MARLARVVGVSQLLLGKRENTILFPLVRPELVMESHVFRVDMTKLFQAAEEPEMIVALSLHVPDEAFNISIHVGSTIRSFDNALFVVCKFVV